ncbi:MAG TPA: hypothetical protein VMU95_07650 [Trebonia sp.]|nr:hypothetical protein [Trebonia sp.]
MISAARGPLFIDSSCPPYTARPSGAPGNPARPEVMKKPPFVATRAPVAAATEEVVCRRATIPWWVTSTRASLGLMIASRTCSAGLRDTPARTVTPGATGRDVQLI